MEPRMLQAIEDRLNPAHTVLLIIDMQNDFCVDGFATSLAGRPLDAAKSIIPQLQRLLDAARAVGVLVCHIGFETLPDNLSDSGPWLSQRRRSTYANDKIAIKGTPGADFIDELQPQEGELAIVKRRYSAFKGTDLDMLLRAHDIRTVVPTGVSTNVCVESTLRDAFEHNFYVCIPADGCASWNMDLHAATLETANARFGLVTDIEKIINIWHQKQKQ